MGGKTTVLGGMTIAFAVLAGCGGDDGGSGTAETGASASASVSASAEDGPEPAACMDSGGMCSCAGACNPGTVLAPQLTCPQPPDESGACSQECCVPEVGSTGSESSATQPTSVDASGTNDTGASCVGAGNPCGPMDYCSTWICVCNAGATEFMTVGSCDAGTCSTDGTAVCEPICTPSGGVAMATDAGCA